MKHYFTKILYQISIFFLIITFVKGNELEDIKSTLPKMLGSNNMGTEFVFGFHPALEETGPNNAIRIYVSSQYETEVRLTIPYFSNKPYMVKTTVPNQVIEFILTPNVGQPYTRGGGGARSTLLPTQVWKGRGIILEADAPIVAYGVVRFQYTSDGFLALPTNKCGTTYIIASYRETANFTSQSLTPYASIIGISDSTEVTYKIGGNNNTWIRDVNDKKWRPLETMTAKLNKGDYWLIASEGAQSDLGGGLVTANKPISVLSGNHCANVPTENSACDYIIEQELPQNLWDKKYYVSNIVDRHFSSVCRFFAKDTNTTFYRDTVSFWTAYSTWGLQEDGWLEKRANPDTNLPVLINGDKPIYVMQYNTGMSEDGVSSDPFQMCVLPSTGFQNYFVFNTPGIKNGYGFRRNYINLIYLPTPNKEIPDYLEIGEVQTNGNIIWKKVKNLPGGLGYPFIENGVPSYYNKIITLSNDGVYHIKSDEPIMVYIYGTADWDSYGFPTSGSFVDPEVPDNIEPKIEGKPIAYSGDNITSGSILISDKDNKGNDNLAFSYVDNKFSYNITYILTKQYNNESKLSSERIDWEVKNILDSAKIVIHAVDNNGNINSFIQKYVNPNPNQKFIITYDLDTLYYTNFFMTVKWKTNLTENIKITLLQNNKEIKVLNESAENTGVFKLYLDENIFSPGRNYSIKLSGAVNQNVADTSNYFSVVSDSAAKIKIITPNDKKIEYLQGQTMDISWETLPQDLKVDIKVVDESGNEVKTFVIDDMANSQHIFSWQIPINFKTGNYAIRIINRNKPSHYEESIKFKVLFNSIDKKLNIILPTDTTVAYFGEEMNIVFKSNYISKFAIWLSLNNTPIYKISDEYAINDTLINNYKFTIPQELTINYGYSIIFIDKDNYKNQPNDVRYSSKSFLITKASSVNNVESNLKINYKIEADYLLLYTTNNVNIIKAEVFDIMGKNLCKFDNINSNNLRIPLNILNTDIIFVKLLINNEYINYKVLLR